MPRYQASDSENAYDFFFRFFFFSIRPTDPISGNAFDGKQKKRGNGLTQRSDEESLKRKVKDCNKVLKTFCNQNGWGFVEHLNIDETCLNNYKLHLNKKGIAILTSNFAATSSAQIRSTLMPKCRGFKMTSLNITSLLKHIDELRVFLNDQNIDVLAINETRLNESISDQHPVVQKPINANPRLKN